MDGNKIRELRKKNGMTIDDLSLKSGFTSSYISQVERNLIEPSLSALGKICKVFNVSVYYFLENNIDKTKITRKHERQKFYIPKGDIELQFVVPINDKKMSEYKFGVYETCIGSGKWDSEDFTIIDSDKCIIIKKGTLLVNLNGVNELLQEGDSIYIGSDLPHKTYNPTDEICEIICITSPSVY